MELELIQAVKQHALDNYEKDGWDLVVETMEDSDIHAIIRNCRTAKGAIAAVKRSIADVHEYRADIQATAW